MIFVEMIFCRVRCSIKNDSDRLRRATQILIATLGAFIFDVIPALGIQQRKIRLLQRNFVMTKWLFLATPALVTSLGCKDSLRLVFQKYNGGI